MKFVLVAILLIHSITSSYEEEVSNTDLEKASDIRDAETIHQDLQSEQPDAQDVGEDSGFRIKKCSKNKYRRYRSQLLKLKSLPYIKIKSSKIRKNYVGKYRCYKRQTKSRSSIGKRSVLYDLCNPCYREKRLVLSTALNLAIYYMEANCKNANCIRLGSYAAGKCEPLYYKIPLPIPKGDCSGVVERTFTFLVGCICKSRSPAFLFN